MNKIKLLGIGIMFLLVVTMIPIGSGESTQYNYVYKITMIGRVTDVYEHEGGTSFLLVRGIGRMTQITNTGQMHYIFRCKNLNAFFSVLGEFRGILTDNFICGTYTLSIHMP